MDRYQIIRIIHDYMSKKPVLKAWIFGSFARGEEKAQSDIDILFVPDFEHGSFTLLTHGGMYEELKQLLYQSVHRRRRGDGLAKLHSLHRGSPRRIRR